MGSRENGGREDGKMVRMCIQIPLYPSAPLPLCLSAPLLLTAAIRYQQIRWEY